MTRLSVIIPGYNTSDEVWARSVKSVLKNLNDCDEVICVDNASKTPPKVLAELSEKDKRVRVFRLEENRGPSPARNYGVDKALGLFVSFVDCDDEVISDVYNESIRRMEEYNADIAVFGVKSVWEAERLYKIDCPCEIKYIGLPDAKDVYDLYRENLLHYPWNKVFRREFLNSNSLRFEEKSVPCEDIVLNLQSIISGARWLIVPVVGIQYNRTHTTLLSRYKSAYGEAMRRCNHMWGELRSAIRDEDGVLASVGVMSEADIEKGEWDNLWRLQSPYSIIERFKYLKCRPALTTTPVRFFIKTLLYQVLRQMFYINLVKRWHIKRQYPSCRSL